MLKVYNEIARYIDQCFIGTTKIYTEKGLVEIQDIKPNDKVYTSDGSLQKVKRIYNDFYEGEVINVRLLNNTKTIMLTPNHPFLKSDGEWSAIKNNDYVLFPKIKHEEDNLYLDDADCYIYGLLHCFSYNISFHDDSKYKSLLIHETFQNKSIVEIINKYFLINNIEYELINNNQYYKFTYLLNSKLKFSKSQIKKLDKNLLILPISKLRWVLKGLIAHGTIYIDQGLITIDNRMPDTIEYIKLIALKLNSPLIYNENISPYYYLPITTEVKELFELPYKMTDDIFKIPISCDFCNKELSSKDVLKTHLVFCKKTPDNILKKVNNLKKQISEHSH
jgi:hypothetical protein